MIWKIIFWAYFIYSLLAVLGFVGINLSPFNTLVILLNLTLIIIFNFGLFSHAYKKKLLSAKHWRWLLIIATLLTIYGIVPIIQTLIIANIIESLLTLLLDIPAFYSLYMLSVIPSKK
jgi:hypothetical protein